MPLQKGFLKPIFTIKEIPKKRFWLGIILGGLTAFVYFNLFHITREFFRLFTGLINDFFWEWDKEETRYYDTVFAALSSLIGQAMCFEVWFNTPKKLKSNNLHFRKRMIINDLRFFTWIFLNIFSRTAFLYGILLFSMHLFLVFSPQKNAPYFLWLIVLVFFMHQWMSFRLTFRKIWKLIMLSAFSLFLLTLLLVKTNLFNPEKLNDTIQEQYQLYTSNVNLPKSSFYQSIKQRSWMTDFSVGFPDNSDEYPAIYYENNPIDPSEIGDAINHARLQKEERIVPYITYRIYADSNVKMDVINQIKQEFRYNTAYKVMYAVNPVDWNSPVKGFPSPYGILRRLPPLDSLFDNKYPAAPPLLASIEPENIILDSNLIFKLTINGHNQFIHHNRRAGIKQIQDSLLSFISEKASSGFIFLYFSKNSNYNTYIKAQEMLNLSFDQVRNEFALKTYFASFESLNYPEQKKIKQMYPFRLVEKMTD